MEKLTLSEGRMERQLLGTYHFPTVAETVRWMGAVQGQDYKPGMWAIGMRMPGSTRETVEAAINDMQIVRSWTMRHTIHFVPLEDVYWMTRISRQRMLRTYLGQMERQAGLDALKLERGTAAFIEALRGKKLLSRPEMRLVLERVGLDTSGQRLYYHLYYAAQCGIIFIGPMTGRQQSFGLVSEWVPAESDQTREKGLEKLAQRYLRSHGPATPQDFSWWAGLTVGDAKLAFSLADAERHTFEDGRDYWVVEEERPPLTQASSRLQLLHPLDEMVIGYKDRSAMLDATTHRTLDPRKDGFFSGVLLDGKVVGSWRAHEQKGNVRMVYRLLDPEAVPGKLLEAEAAHYSRFFGQQLQDVAIERISS